jgi:hypothetical protein
MAGSQTTSAILATDMRRRADQLPLDPLSVEARVTALLRRTRALGQAARRLARGEAPGLPEGLVGSLGTVIIELLEIRAVLLARSGLAPKAARSAGQALMVREYLGGDPLRKVGARHGVSYQRVQQLMLARGACRAPEAPRRCSVCGAPAQTRGLCGSHYLRLRKYGDPEFVPQRGVNADHGTQRRYSAGCRCAACRAANTARYHERSESRHHALASAAVTHGSASLYRNWGCRLRYSTQSVDKALPSSAIFRAQMRTKGRSGHLSYSRWREMDFVRLVACACI